MEQPQIPEKLRGTLKENRRVVGGSYLGRGEGEQHTERKEVGIIAPRMF